MNTLLVLGLQVTLVALGGIFVSLATRKWLLTACAFSSWPSWLHSGSSRGAEGSATSPQTPQWVNDREVHPYLEHLYTTPWGTTFSLPTWAENLLIRNPSSSPSVTETEASSTGPQSAWTWGQCLTLCAGVAMLIGLIRVIGGLWAVRLFVRTSRPLKSQSLLEQVDLLRAEMSCTQPVEVRECPQMATAATVGWRRPVVLLSDSWQSWTPEQLRSVLAHEIAHITRGDFFATVAAQVGVVLHFYHPLVHWLANRLRLEQELAADALAAKVVGGSRAYLNAIGELALKQSSEPVGWPAHSFLPTRRTFLRRIEMLRDLKFLSGGNSRLAKWATLASVAAVTLVAIGLRPPGGEEESSSAQAAPVSAVMAASQTVLTQAQSTTQLETKYVPAEASIVIAANPAVLSQQFENLKTLKLIPAETPNPQDAVKGCKQVTVVMIIPANLSQGLDRCTGSCLEFGTTEDRDAAMRNLSPPPGGPSWQKMKLLLAEYEVYPPTGQARYLPDDRTLILASQDVIQWMILAGPKSLSPLTQSESWKAAAHGSVAIAVDAASVQKAMATAPPNPLIGLFAPLWSSASSHTLSLKFADKSQLSLTSQAKDAASSQQLEGTFKAGIAMLTGMLDQAKTSPDPTTKATVEGLLPIVAGHKLTTTGTLTKLTIEADLTAVATLLAPPISQARQAAQRAQQQNNMKQILLALHNYHDVFGHFPPASVVDPQSGVARSWRVEILPFIDGAPLWNEYKKNEPWDSESNKKILAQMPRVFRHPSQPAGATNTSIFAAYGDGFAFQKDDKIGLKLHDIADGTSATIAIIEAQAEIPWTKPEELLIDLSQGAPKSFGFDPTAFGVGLCDGSVQMIARTIEPQLLKVMFTRNGGEVFKGFDRPKPTVPVPAVPATPR